MESYIYLQCQKVSLSMEDFYIACAYIAGKSDKKKRKLDRDKLRWNYIKPNLKEVGCGDAVRSYASDEFYVLLTVHLCIIL